MARPITSREIKDLTTLENPPRLSVYGGLYFSSMPVPDIRWLIPGLLTRGVPSVLAAKGGLGKSFTALQCCVALSTGKSFLGAPGQPPMGAIYLGVEDSRDTLHRRVISILAKYKARGDWTDLDQENFNNNFVALDINWKAQNATAYLPGLIPELELLLSRFSEKGITPGIIVIDTLARVSDGDENTVQALRPVLNACHRLAEEGWTPWVLHHVSKGQDGARTRDKISVVDRMSVDWVRGSSSIVDNFRGVVQMTSLSDQEAETAGLDPDRARMGQYLVFGVTKLNGGQKAPWIVLEQDEAGRWEVRTDSAEILAKLRGTKAVADLSNQNALLKDLYKAQTAGREMDRGELASAHCGDATDPQGALRTMLRKLRAAGLVHKTELGLTISGRERVQSLPSGHA